MYSTITWLFILTMYIFWECIDECISFGNRDHLMWEIIRRETDKKIEDTWCGNFFQMQIIPRAASKQPKRRPLSPLNISLYNWLCFAQQQWPRHQLRAPDLDVIGWKNMDFFLCKLQIFFGPFTVSSATDFNLAIKICEYSIRIPIYPSNRAINWWPEAYNCP